MSSTFSDEPGQPHTSILGRLGLKSEMRSAVLERWARGMTSPEIADELCITRNAVMGYVCRSRDGSSPAARRPHLGGRAPKASPNRLPFEIPGIGACQFISGMTLKTYRFCGAPAVPGKPYCAPHCARCYAPPKPEAK